MRGGADDSELSELSSAMPKFMKGGNLSVSSSGLQSHVTKLAGAVGDANAQPAAQLGGKRRSRKGSKKASKKSSKKRSMKGGKRRSRKASKKSSKKSSKKMHGGKRRSRKASKKSSKKSSKKASRRASRRSQRGGREMNPVFAARLDIMRLLQKKGLKGGVPMVKLISHYWNKTTAADPEGKKKEAMDMIEKDDKAGSLQKKYDDMAAPKTARSKSRKSKKSSKKGKKGSRRH